MNAKSIIGFSAFLFIISAIIISGVLTDKEKENAKADYYIICSDMFGKSGELQGIDIDGNIVCKSKLKMQDVTKYSFDGDVFVAGGSRANNNIVIGKDGEYRTFFLLDNPHMPMNCILISYTG